MAEEKARILVVDDQPANLFAIREILDDPSYEVVTTTDPNEALKHLLGQEFALLLFDVFMKDMDGLELAALVKSREKSKRTPIIFLTAARANMDFIRRAYAVGAADFLEKPLEAEIVRSKVAVFVDLFRKNREIERQSLLLRERDLREHDARLNEMRIEEEKRFQDLVEGIEHGFVWSADPESLIANYISPRSELILGYPVRDWMEHSGFLLRHVHPDDREALERVLSSAQTGKDVGLDHRFIRSDGETIWLHTGVRLARRGAGAGTELRGLSMDISALKQIEEALTAAVQARDEFLSIASHELRTPLTPMLLQLQLLERTIKTQSEISASPERLTKTLDSWRKQIDHLTRLIENMLDISRISAGHLQLNLVSADFRRILDDVIERYHSHADRAGCRISIAGPSQVQGHWDVDRLEQVFTNLISNAVKYAPGTAIEVTLSDLGDWVEASVQDHGPGIPADKQEKIFNRFERATSADYVSGLGLGLYISRNIVEGHGGKLSLSSQPGNGSVFTVRLPKQVPARKSA